ncbi:UPF0160 protein MYG1 isoform 2 [Schistosoma japonicum]|uniref:UPF0160 protein MYG1 isoform 2 n=2 Tax=Schistosoma japonicum TaxID=6182 RepID=A0A4Z2DTE4_SCHJA|nr:UPF0160 protein MYG1, mitochondrial [Schistosoma japonicum]TNN19812.1 UPF0160 protein MYG1 isoform 2 [Schistosoma japonicum]TNN19813.1 UPF0160 protein MYG1 isoform 2 [Schistosoma japonicum]
MTSIKRIGTHDGCFHCDEVLAVVLLKHLPEYKNASVVRSRDPDVLSVCDVVVDVGGVYDPQTYRFDHHQKDFSLTWSKYFDVKMWDVKLSSAGLVYVHFGKRVLSLLTGLEINHEVLEKIFMRVYESFILEIDGQDNGTPQSKMPLKYNINTGLYCRVRRLNPWWNSGSEESESAFQRAINLVSREFLDTVDYFANCWWPARHIVAQAMSCREDVDPSKMIIVLDRSCPWKSHLFDLEREERMETVVYPEPLHRASYRPVPKFPPQILFVVLPSDGNWVVQAVPKEKFEIRLPFPIDWRSLRDDQSCAITGIPGCIFVHNSGHLGSNKTRDGAIEMARSVINDSKLQQENITHTTLTPPKFSRGRGRKFLVNNRNKKC